MIHKQAAIQTAKILGTAVGIAVATSLVFMFVPIDTIIAAAVIGVLVFLVKIVYEVQKSQIQHAQEAEARRLK